MTLVHSVDVAANTSYFRTTSSSFRTTNPGLHSKVVDGQGSANSAHGSRYAPPNALTVYLAESIECCLAERLFYFQREYLKSLDAFHIHYRLGMATMAPPFQRSLTIWEVQFGQSVSDIADLNSSTAGYFGVYPAMMGNPSQDYEHLKDRRAHIKANGYHGLRAPSSRSRQGGWTLALFDDQSTNVASIAPANLEIRLIQPNGMPFKNQAMDELDYEACQVRIAAASTPGPAWVQPYSAWTRVPFNH